MQGNAPTDADCIVEAFSKLHEDDFTKRVLLPLLRRLGYTSVEFNGGNTEEGKDIICKSCDRFGTEELTVTAVKKFKFTTRASENQTFHEIVRQLEQAAENPVPSISGKSSLPSEVIFITPFIIPSRILKSRFVAYAKIRPNRLKIYDGGKIAELLTEHCPDVLTELLGPKNQLSQQLLKIVNERILERTLRVDIAPNPVEIHVGLDFNIGKLSLRTLVRCDIQTETQWASFSEDEFEQLCFLSREIQEMHGVKVLVSDEARVRSNTERVRSEAEKRQELEEEKKKRGDVLANVTSKIRPLLANIPRYGKSTCDDLEDLVREEKSLPKNGKDIEGLQRKIERVRRLVKSIASLSNIDNELVIQGLGLRQAEWASLRKTSGTSPNRKVANRHAECLKHVKLISAEFPVFRELQVLFREYVQARAEHAFATLEVESYSATGDSRPYRCEINSYELVDQCTTYMKKIRDVNRCLTLQVKKRQLEQALHEVEKGIHFVEKVFPWLLSNGIVRIRKPKARKEKLDRIPLLRIAKRGFSFILLGEAGAGKTTSLKSFARKRHEEYREKGITTIVPMFHCDSPRLTDT